MNLLHSSDGAYGDDDNVEYESRASQTHMQPAIAFHHEAALQQKKNHPARHESAVNKNKRGNLLRYWLSGIVQAVQVKHVKTSGYAGNHHQTGDQVKEPLSAFRLNRSSACG